MPSVDLVPALLPASELGLNATAQVTHGVGGLTLLCGGGLRGASSAEREWLSDNQQGRMVGEAIVEFTDAAAAAKAIEDDRATAGTIDGCSVTLGSSTKTYDNDIDHPVPALCPSQGRHFETFLHITGESSPLDGMYMAVQCSRWDVSVTAVSRLLVADPWFAGVVSDALNRFTGAQRG